MSTEFAIAEVMPGKLNALVKNIMRQTGESDPNAAVRLVNSGEWVVSKSTRSWYEDMGIIYFSVTSDGTTGPEWIKRLEDNGSRVGDYARSVLCSPDFKPTSGITTTVAVLKGFLFGGQTRNTKEIRAQADRWQLSKPNAEVACLIREKFTNKEIEAMGLWYIVAMHKPIEDSDGAPGLLSADCGVGGSWLRTHYDEPGFRWRRSCGFAFARS